MDLGLFRDAVDIGSWSNQDQSGWFHVVFAFWNFASFRFHFVWFNFQTTRLPGLRKTTWHRIYFRNFPRKSTSIIEFSKSENEKEVHLWITYRTPCGSTWSIWLEARAGAASSYGYGSCGSSVLAPFWTLQKVRSGHFRMFAKLLSYSSSFMSNRNESRI